MPWLAAAGGKAEERWGARTSRDSAVGVFGAHGAQYVSCGYVPQEPRSPLCPTALTAKLEKLQSQAGGRNREGCAVLLQKKAHDGAQAPRAVVESWT
jgi:hypothetical protein